MNQTAFSGFANGLFNEAYMVLTDKGKDYARNDNAFHNFETTAEFTGMTREQVLGCHMYKHVAALYRYIRDGEVDSEGLRGRAIDLINYTVFLVAMHEESRTFGAVDLAPGRDVRVAMPTCDCGESATGGYHMSWCARYNDTYTLSTDDNGNRVYAKKETS